MASTGQATGAAMYEPLTHHATAACCLTYTRRITAKPTSGTFRIGFADARDTGCAVPTSAARKATGEVSDSAPTWLRPATMLFDLGGHIGATGGVPLSAERGS